MSENTTRVCACNLWEKNIKKINDRMSFYFIRFGVQYDGDYFEYCPWCGKKLDEQPCAIIPPKKPIEPPNQRIKEDTGEVYYFDIKNNK